MAVRGEVFNSYPIDCRGIDLARKPVLDAPTQASITIYQNGEREVGCVYLEKGVCEVSGNQRVACFHLFPESSNELFNAEYSVFTSPFARSEEKEPVDKRDELSEREIYVLNLLAQGLDNQQISEVLGRKRTTVKSNISNTIYEKLDVHTKTSAVLVAATQGLIDLIGAIGHVREADIHSLTKRQLDVLLFLTADVKSEPTNKAIAKELGINERTVKGHFREIIARLRVRNRTQAALVYYVAKNAHIINLESMENPQT